MHGINEDQNARDEKQSPLFRFLLFKVLFRIMMTPAVCKVVCDFSFLFYRQMYCSYGIPQIQKSSALFSACLPYVHANGTMRSFKSSRDLSIFSVCVCVCVNNHSGTNLE